MKTCPSRIGCGGQLAAGFHFLITVVLLGLALGPFAALSTRADGCFVFHWDKNTDINEPAQKAIILHDAGHEDLLLQVKYEGPLKEFGWLIPVPALPTVEKGSMRPFYELSKLTQQRFEARTLSYALGGDEAVKVIEIKTVGAYEVAILSAQDAASLARWLKAHDYSLPEGKAGIVDEYTRRRWYFVAAKIQLDPEASQEPDDAIEPGVQDPTEWSPGVKPPEWFAPPAGEAGLVNQAPRSLALTLAASGSSNTPAASARPQKTVQQQLASGELHPLHISFDTPKCVYPLRISALGGNSSKVSLYLLSAAPLLERSSFNLAVARLPKQKFAGGLLNELIEPELNESLLHNSRIWQLAWQMDTLAPANRTPGWRQRDWPEEDLRAIGNEGQPPMSDLLIGDDRILLNDLGIGPPECLKVRAEEMPECVKDLPRLKGKVWYLTRQTKTFSPLEMHDLVFEPARSVLAKALRAPACAAAAALLAQLDILAQLDTEGWPIPPPMPPSSTEAVKTFLAACQSRKPAVRIEASKGLRWLSDPRVVDMLPGLFKDELPHVRLHAAEAAAANWDRRLCEPLTALLRDRYVQVRLAATACLCSRAAEGECAPVLGLLRDPDPDVQACALQVLALRRRVAIPRAELLRLLGSQRMRTVALALDLLEAQEHISSTEAAPLLASPVTLARLAGLAVLWRKADADAAARALPLLRDTNSIVRNHAVGTLRLVTGQDFPPDDPAQWERWWAANRDTFKAPLRTP
jgi:hypothetical protein